MRRFGLSNPRIFGSALHGQDVDGSDLNLLVDPLPDTTTFDWGDLQVELEELLPVPVDVLTTGDLPLKFSDQVLGQAQAV